MKKGLVLLTAGLLTLTLGGCGGQSAQDTYTDALTEQADLEKFNAGTFSLKFDELNFDYQANDASTNAMMSMVATQLKDVQLTGDYLVDMENEALDYKMKVEALGQEIPMDFVMTKDTIYYSVDSFADIMDMAASFSEEVSLDMSNVSEDLTGKYVRMDQNDLNMTGTEDLLDFSNLTKGSQGDLLTEYTKTLPKDSFKKEGDIITHKYDKKEIAGLIDYGKENGIDEVKKAFEDVDTKDFDDLEKFDLTLAIDTKSKKMDYKIAFAYSDDEGSVDAVVAMSMTPKEEDKTVKVPAEADTISMKEFQTAIEDGAQYQVTDAEFDSLYSSLEQLTDVYSKEDLEEILEGYSLTDEQKAKIDALYE